MDTATVTSPIDVTVAL
uniref:Uncharacterized protein n=1 Tax=Anguilla anguilla TaxID=7936 RepID=A0A0E9Q0A8_ANGAN